MFRRQLGIRRWMSTSSPSSKGVAATATTSTPSIAVVPGKNNSTTKHGPGGRSSTSGHVVTVFGCSGFLGRYLVNQLAKAGSQVVVPYRASIEYIRDLKVMGDLGQVVPTKFDLRDEESIRQCIRHSDTVYNLIGRDYETRNFSFYDTHVEGARTIARLCKEENVNRLIHVSALNANPKSQSEFLKTKGQAEIAVELEFPDAIIVRPGTCYGWEDRMLSYLGQTVTHPVKRWIFGGFIPLVDGGKHTLSPVYVNDVARGLYALLELENPKQFYEFYGPRQMAYREVVELFCEYARKPFSPVNVPYSLFRSIVNLTQLNPLARINVHDVDRWVVDEGHTEGAGTLEEVGVKPKTLEELAIRFVRHFRGNEWVDQPASTNEIKYWERSHNEGPSA